jgi:hypothetical protein
MLAGKTDYTVKQGLNPAKCAASAPILHRFLRRLLLLREPCGSDVVVLKRLLSCCLAAFGGGPPAQTSP